MTVGGGGAAACCWPWPQPAKPPSSQERRRTTERAGRAALAIAMSLPSACRQHSCLGPAPYMRLPLSDRRTNRRPLPCAGRRLPISAPRARHPASPGASAGQTRRYSVKIIPLSDAGSGRRRTAAAAPDSGRPAPTIRRCSTPIRAPSSTWSTASARPWSASPSAARTGSPTGRAARRHRLRRHRGAGRAYPDQQPRRRRCRRRRAHRRDHRRRPGLARTPGRRRSRHRSCAASASTRR